MDDIRETFFAECDELLEATAAGLGALKDDACDGETVRTVHRAVHSMKGGAAAFGFDALSGFAYAFEKTLKEVCEGGVSLDEHSLSLFTQASATLSGLVDDAREGREPRMGEARKAQMRELNALRGANAGEAEEEEILDFAPAAIKIDADAHGTADDALGYVIEFTPYPDLYDLGNDASAIIGSLEDLGEVRVACDASALPPFDNIDAAGAYLSWTIQLSTSAPRSEVEELFEFVEGECALRIEAWRDDAAADPTPTQSQ